MAEGQILDPQIDLAVTLICCSFQVLSAVAGNSQDIRRDHKGLVCKHKYTEVYVLLTIISATRTPPPEYISHQNGDFEEVKMYTSLSPDSSHWGGCL